MCCPTRGCLPPTCTPPPQVIQGGRHLLAEQLVGAGGGSGCGGARGFIPNDTVMREGQGRLQVVTG